MILETRRKILSSTSRIIADNTSIIHNTYYSTVIYQFFYGHHAFRVLNFLHRITVGASCDHQSDEHVSVTLDRSYHVFPSRNKMIPSWQPMIYVTECSCADLSIQCLSLFSFMFCGAPHFFVYTGTGTSFSVRFRNKHTSSSWYCRVPSRRT